MERFRFDHQRAMEVRLRGRPPLWGSCMHGREQDHAVEVKGRQDMWGYANWARIGDGLQAQSRIKINEQKTIK